MDDTEIVSIPQARLAIKLLKLELKQKDQEIRNKDQQIQNKILLLQNKDQLIQNKDQLIHSKDDLIKQKDEMIMELKNMIDDLTKTPNQVQFNPNNDKNSILTTINPSIHNAAFSTPLANQQMSPQNDHNLFDTTPNSIRQNQIGIQSVNTLAEINAEKPMSYQELTNLKRKLVELSDSNQPIDTATETTSYLSQLALKSDIQEPPNSDDVKLEIIEPMTTLNQSKLLKSNDDCSNKKKAQSRESEIISQCKNCNELKYLFCGQICRSCYSLKNSEKKRSTRYGKCKQCKKVKSIASQSLCSSCYIKSKPKRDCAACGDLSIILGLNMCRRCYDLNKSIRKIICQNCKNFRAIYAKNMCGPCYGKRKRLMKNNKNNQVESNTSANPTTLKDFFNTN